jgi:hypothetical protein
LLFLFQWAEVRFKWLPPLPPSSDLILSREPSCWVQGSEFTSSAPPDKNLPLATLGSRCRGCSVEVAVGRSWRWGCGAGISSSLIDASPGSQRYGTWRPIGGIVLWLAFFLNFFFFGGCCFFYLYVYIPGMYRVGDKKLFSSSGFLTVGRNFVLFIFLQSAMKYIHSI